MRFWILCGIGICGALTMVVAVAMLGRLHEFFYDFVHERAYSFAQRRKGRSVIRNALPYPVNDPAIRAVAIYWAGEEIERGNTNRLLSGIAALGIEMMFVPLYLLGPIGTGLAIFVQALVLLYNVRDLGFDWPRRLAQARSVIAYEDKQDVEDRSPLQE
jgi:hypothetical protein